MSGLRRSDQPDAGEGAVPVDVPQRVSKILASRGVCSRREAERLIAAGQVTVDGVVVSEQGSKALPSAMIEVSGEGQTSLAGAVTIALHKPPGIVSTMPQGGQRAAVSLVTRANVWGRVAPAEAKRALAARELAVAGRLDRASRGLLILTDDGVVARALIGGNRIAKRYLVTLAADVSSGQVERLNRPMRLDDRRLLPMKVEHVGPRSLRFELREGMKHQIRRCCGKVGLEVTDLLRDAVGAVELGALPEGKWRPLNRGEVEALRSTVVR